MTVINGPPREITSGSGVCRSLSTYATAPMIISTTPIATRVGDGLSGLDRFRLLRTPSPEESAAAPPKRPAAAITRRRISSDVVEGIVLGTVDGQSTSGHLDHGRLSGKARIRDLRRGLSIA
jgi:hypothetical protein